MVFILEDVLESVISFYYTERMKSFSLFSHIWGFLVKEMILEKKEKYSTLIYICVKKSKMPFFYHAPLKNLVIYNMSEEKELRGSLHISCYKWLILYPKLLFFHLSCWC